MFDDGARLHEVFSDDLMSSLDIIVCHLESVDSLIKGERLTGGGLNEGLGLTHELHNFVVQSELVNLLDNGDFGAGFHANLVTMSVSNSEISLDEVSVSRFARENVVKDLDVSLNGKGFLRLNLRNGYFHVVKEVSSLIIVARFKMESFRIWPFGFVLESELYLNHISSPGSENVTGLLHDNSSFGVLSSLLLGISEGLLSVLTHVLAKEVLHEPADLFLHHARIHALILLLSRSLTIVGIDSAPGFFLFPLFGQLFIDLSFMVSIGGHVLTNNSEDGFGALLRLVDLKHSIFLRFGGFAVSAKIVVLAD